MMLSFSKCIEQRLMWKNACKARYVSFRLVKHYSRLMKVLLMWEKIFIKTFTLTLFFQILIDFLRGVLKTNSKDVFIMSKPVNLVLQNVLQPYSQWLPTHPHLVFHQHWLESCLNSLPNKNFFLFLNQVWRNVSSIGLRASITINTLISNHRKTIFF